MSCWSKICLIAKIHPDFIMALARGTIETITCIFSWTLSWQDLFSRSGCYFQIFGDSTYDTCNQHHHHYCLETLFQLLCLPEHLVTDKGTQFTSDEFKKFLRENDILHTLTAPGHPAANRLAESYVGEFI